MEPIEEKKIKITTSEGQATFVPESIASDEPTLKRLLASFFGTDNFSIVRKEEGGETVIHVSKLAGAKGGAAAPLKVLRKRKGGENPVIPLYRQLAGVDLLARPDEAVLLQERIERALKEGGQQRSRMQAARTRLKQATGAPSPLAIPGF